MVILLHPSLNSYPSSHLSLILPILFLYSPRSHSPNIPSPSPDAPSLPCGGRDADERGGRWRGERGGDPAGAASAAASGAASAAEARPASAPEARERGGGSVGERDGGWRRERGGGPWPASARKAGSRQPQRRPVCALRRSAASVRKLAAGHRDGSGSALTLWVSRANGPARHD